MKTGKTSWRRDPFLWGSLALVLLIMGVIFSFSAQSAVQSGGSSGRIVSKLIRWLYPDYGTLSPERQYELYVRLDFIVRKTAHLLEFTVRCACICRPSRAIPRSGGRSCSPGGSARCTPPRTSCTSSSAPAARRG